MVYAFLIFMLIFALINFISVVKVTVFFFKQKDITSASFGVLFSSFFVVLMAFLILEMGH